MKPFFQKLPTSVDRSFDIFDFEFQALSYPLHFHPQLELTYFESYHGSMLIGDQLFKPLPQDVLLIGPNIPHGNLDYEGQEGQVDKGAIAIFDSYSFGEDFWTKSEAASMGKFLESFSGVKVYRDHDLSQAIANSLSGLQQTRFSKQLVGLLEIIEQLTHVDDKAQDLLVTPFKAVKTGKQQERIDKVYQYLSKSFQQQLTLQDVATEVHMSPEALSRYFKSKTGKTIFGVLLEFKIHHAKKLLSSTEMSITQIAYDSGFVNLSTFNRSFLQSTELTPRDYRKANS